MVKEKDKKLKLVADFKKNSTKFIKVMKRLDD